MDKDINQKINSLIEKAKIARDEYSKSGTS